MSVRSRSLVVLALGLVAAAALAYPLALLDTTGAMASWAECGPGAYKASTTSMQMQVVAPPPKGDLVAYGRCVQRDNEVYWSDVEVADQASGQIAARGTVLYRIVT